jgi:endonuclease/exonuclease/phosphatase family metal-dependent hydrolase
MRASLVAKGFTGKDPNGASSAQWLQAVLAAVVLAASLAGPREARCACRETAPGDAAAKVRWVRAGTSEDAASLDRWCAAVGGPLLTGPETSLVAAPVVDGLAVVVWNVHVGSAALERLVAELREGELSGGRPVEHFVLLLQEAVRVGSSIPGAVPSGALTARAIAAPVDPSRSIEMLAARAGLFGFYVPSMRNGAEYREDRGNAILSTLELSDPAAIELPHERQRRVAVSASVSVALHNGKLASLRLVSAHLDNVSRGVRFWRSFGAGRARQVRGLLQALDGEAAVVLGGDFNTWFGESHEEAIVLLRDRFPSPARLPAAVTYSPPWGLPERQVDYLLLRLPAGWQARYRVAADRRESDHAPLIGWLSPPTHDVSAVREPEEVRIP